MTDEEAAEREMQILGMKERSKTEFLDLAATSILAACASTPTAPTSPVFAFDEAEKLWEERERRCLKRSAVITTKVQAIQEKYGLKVKGEHEHEHEQVH